MVPACLTTLLKPLQQLSPLHTSTHIPTIRSTIAKNPSCWRPWQAPNSTLSFHNDEGTLPSTSVIGTSREPICIPSDINSDTEDSADDASDFDDSRSDTSLPPAYKLVISPRSQSRPMGHADSPVRRVDNHDGAHSGKTTPPDGNALCVIAMAAESPTSAPHSTVGSSTPAHESPVRNFTHPDLNGVPCQGDGIPTSGTSTRHNTVPETPHGCPGHLPLDSSEGQDLGMVDATKPGAVVSDAIQTATPISSSQNASASSTSAQTAQPLIVAPLETVEVPNRNGDVPQSAAPSRCNSVPGTRVASSERKLAPETPQGQSPATTGCESGDVEAQAYEAASGLSSGTQEAPSPPQGPITRRRSRRIATHRLTHKDDDSNDNNADDGSQGSKDDLDHTSLLCDRGYCPSVTIGEERDQEGEISDEDEQCPRKRRRVSRSPSGLMRHAAASVQLSRQGRASLRSTNQSAKRGKRSRASGILSQASQGTSTSNEAELRAVLARFEEWPVEDASLKRITENGKATFQLQFNWTPYTKHGHTGSTGWDSADSPSARTMGRAKRASATRTPYTTAEDDLLRKMKEVERLAWPEIHRRFNETYPERSAQSLQVHYSTKLKSRERS